MRDQQLKIFNDLAEEIKSYSIISTSFNAVAKAPVNIPFSKYLLLGWKIRAKNHIANTCGRSSIHFLEFEKAEQKRFNGDTADTANRLYAAFTAAQRDFQDGLAPSVSALAHAEVFNAELDQAQELLNHNYVTAAAVIAGIVLESKLRLLCVNRSLPTGKLDKMNSELVKAEVYDTNTQKRITAIAGVRNSAAHGKSDEINKPDVQGVIDDVRRFLEKNIS